MSNGGYKGASPARETSPEQYPGVWELTEQFQAQADGNWPFQETDCAPKSLRLNSADSAQLTRSVAVPGDRKTWTWSGWIKRHKFGVVQRLFAVSGAANNNDHWFALVFLTDDKLYLGGYTSFFRSTGRVLRDPSAWMHVHVVADLNHAVSSEKLRIYINGERSDDGTGSEPSFTGVNNSVTHHLGAEITSNYCDLSVSEVQFIDGQALEPDAFTFVDGQGILQPKRFTGDYSNGPVYSNAVPTADGFRSGRLPNHGFDGDLTSYIALNNTTFNLDVGSWGLSGVLEVYTGSNHQYAVDGGSASSMTANGWTNVGNANSITTLTFTRTDGNYPYFNAIRLDGVTLLDPSVGRNSFHLDFSDGVKDQSGLGNDWTGNGVSIFSGSAVSRIWETTSTYTPQGGSPTNHWAIASGGGSATKAIDGNYGDLFSEVLEPGKIYAFTTAWPNGDDNGGWWFGDSNANGLSGTHPNQGRGSNSLGQRGRSANPANDTAGAYGTFLSPNGLSTASDSNLSGFQNINPYGTTSIDWVVDRVTNKVWAKPSSNSTWVKGGNPSDASSTPTFHLPATGNLYFGFNQHSSMSSPGATITSYSFTPTDRADDILVDSPVNGYEASTGAGGERRGNYASLNPLQKYSAIALSDGNLAFTDDNTSNGGDQGVHATIMPTSGKFYWEMEFSVLASENYVGLSKHDKLTQAIWTGGAPDGYYYYNNGSKIGGGNGNGGVSYGASFAANDVIGIAADWDNGKITFYKNGSSQGDAFTGVDLTGYIPAFYFNTNQSTTGTINFGQKPYKYQNAGVDRPSADYKPLATSFLPEPSELAKNPSKAFDILLWSGDGGNSDRTISGIDMESGPDMVWSKTRNHAYHNNIFDSVRGFGTSGGAALTTDYKDSQASGGVIKSTDSTSITWEKDSGNGYVWYGESGKNYVSWLWDAGTATTSIAVGGSNSLAYDQSQTWSGLWTGSTGYGSFTNLHDADDTDYAQSLNATLTFPSSIALTSLKIRHSSSFGTATLSINGTDVTSQLATSGTKPLTTITGFTSLTSISMSGADYQSNVHTLYEIFVNDKKLVDNGVTVASVPGAACDVRANPEAGFSIVKVDSPNSTEARVHGLSKAPDFIIAKATASGNTQHYHMFHSYFGKSHYATFTGDAWASSDQWGSQEPNSHSFYVKTNTGSGANFSGGMIYYIWHAVENYSAMGSYVGTGVGDGPMIHLGWEPKWLMIKSTDTSRHWRIYDATREPSNVKTLTLHASTANTETHFGSDELDFLSNGFKIRSTGSFHNSQDKVYLYVAFAANPFAFNTRAH